jgi:hypothetical protein
MPHARADEKDRVEVLGLFHRTISEVEDAILQAKARQAYRTQGEPARAIACSIGSGLSWGCAV